MGNSPALNVLGQRLKDARRRRNKTLDDVHKDTGVSIATLSRIERGDAANIESKTLIAIANWLRISLDSISPAPVRVHAGKSTPDVVELHLRADKNLNSTTATALSNAFRMLYDQFAAEAKKKA
jgi:transcriptional regulator with XRE-family HTH domain